MDVNPGAGSFWLPGMGVTGTDERAAAKVIDEYDHDLVLGQNQETGEWAVFSTAAGQFNDGQPFPVLGLGRQLPTADEIQKKLFQGDVRRHGKKIFEQLQRRNDAKAEAGRKLNESKIEVAGEAMAWAHNKMTGSHPRVFIPSSVRSVE